MKLTYSENMWYISYFDPYTQHTMHSESQCTLSECCYINDVYVNCDTFCDAFQPPVHIYSLALSFACISIVLYGFLLYDRYNDIRRMRSRESVCVQTEMNPTVCIVIEPDNTLDVGDHLSAH